MSGLVVLASSCSDYLETNPTDKTSGTTIFEDARNAEVAMNGIYRSTYVSGWSSGSHESFGIMASNIFVDVLGEDFVQSEQGNGWFWYDYRYLSRTKWDNKGWRSYAQWNFYYTLISNANYIIAQEGKIPGDEVLATNIVAQAYAMRAYCYFQLVQQFAQTYKGHEDWKGVPIYVEPTSSTSVGAPRSPVKDVYAQIDSDLDKSLALFKSSNMKQKHISYVDSCVANGFKARVALVENDWNKALYASTLALGGNRPVLEGEDLLSGMNSVKLKDVMWGAEVQSDQSTAYASFYSHMDAAATGMYAASSRKCISTWLYSQILPSDIRLNWWKPKLSQNQNTGPEKSYNQIKFRFADIKQFLGDYIYMRTEEMILIKAEAECRLGRYSEAVNTLMELMSKRIHQGSVNDYKAYIEGLSQSSDYTFANGTYGDVVTLLDEILLQRRIELWGEGHRMYDIMRLKKGFTRDYPNSLHPDRLPTIQTNISDAPQFILTIPQTEFDGNTSFTAADQNPLD